jgi:hypothetical protein
MAEEKKGQDIPDHESDLQERVDGMNKGVSELSAKYELGLGAFPKINQDGTLSASPIWVSTRKVPVEKDKDSNVGEKKVTVESEITNPAE